jgi:hypothetical protein
MALPGKKVARKETPPARLSDPGGARTKDPAGALLARLEDAFTEDERRQILIGALLGMDRAAREHLCAQLGATGATLAPLLGLAPVAARGQAPAAVSPQRIEQDWQLLWKEWDRIVKATDNGKSPYIQNSISYTTPDLDTDTLVADLEKVAARLLLLLPLHLAHPGPKPVDLAKKLASSLGKLAPSYQSYIILPEQGATLGTATTQLALRWLWQHDPKLKPAARLARLGKLASALFESEPCFFFEEGTLASFMARLGEKERQEMTQWLEENREKQPWKDAFENGWGPGAPLVRLLGREE